MASSIIGALRVLLGIDTAEFETGVKKVQTKLGFLGSVFQEFGKGVFKHLNLRTTLEFFNEIIEHAAKLGRQAQTMGLVVEEVSRLEFVAKKAAIPLDQLARNFSRLGRNMIDVASGAAGPESSIARAFDRLDVSVTNSQGNLKGTMEILLDLADQFKALPPGIEEAGLAYRLFGVRGEQLLPILNRGREGIAEWIQEAEKFGLVVDTNTAEAAKAWTKAFKDMQNVSQGLGTQIVKEMAPAIVGLAAGFREFIGTGESTRQIAVVIKSEFVSLALGVARSRVELTLLVEFAKAAYNNLITLADGLDEVRWQEFQDKVAAANKEFELFTAGMSQSVNNVKRDFGDFPEVVGDPIDKVADKSLANLIDKQKQHIIDLQQHVAGLKVFTTTLGMTAGALERMNAETELRNRLADQDIKLTASQEAQVQRLLDQIPAIIERNERLGAIYGTLSSGVDSLADGLIDVARGAQKLGDVFKDVLDQMLRDLTKFFLNRLFQQLLGIVFQGFTGGFGGPTNIIPGGFPGRQHGGSVSRNRGYMVGERGPEMFVPRTSGSIIPNTSGVMVNLIDQRTTASPPVEQRQGSDGSQDFVIRDTIRRQLPGELNRLMPAQFGARPRLNQRGT